MQTLETSLSNFAEAFNKYNYTYGASQEGKLLHRSEAQSVNVDSRIPLSSELKFFYETYEMVGTVYKRGHQLDVLNIEIGGAPVYLYPLDLLAARQNGFRWIGRQEPFKENPKWNPSWVVIADKNDDPIIVDTAKKGSPVYASYEGGDEFPLCDSLATFFDALAIILETVNKFDGDVIDEETLEVKSDYVETLEPLLEEVIGPEYTKNMFEYLSYRE
ncbi:hypothetical protein [Paenibacillus sp. A14]|uniref:hypothetical protein n=1 Tax=Paenibacillus sp. A14 TaxID=3119820 RepID=UPI002FE23BC1